MSAKIRIALAAFLAAGTAASRAAAAPIRGYEDDADNHVYASGGWSSAPDVELGYGRRLFAGARRLDLEGELAAPIFLLPELDSFRVEPSARLALAEYGKWKLAGRFGLPIQTGSNQTFRFLSFGARATASAGYFARGGFASLEVGYLETLSTYVAATDRARQVYPGIRDGFYAPSGGYFDAALAGGVTLGRGWEIGLRLGYRTSAALNPPPLVPYVGELGVSWSF